MCFASIALADDFKTTDGKEYKDATVTRVEPDGIVVRTKRSITKLYFAELPKNVQERFHYDPGNATAYAAQMAAAQRVAAQQAEESIRQQKEQQKQQGEQAAKLQNIQALQNAYQSLLEQEEALQTAIGRAENAKEAAWRKWASQGYVQGHATDPAEADLPLLKDRLQNVQDEKQRVRNELERAQRESR